jgi:hypothetical protein
MTTYCVTAINLNVREDPSITAKVKTVPPQDTVVELLSREALFLPFVQI